MAGGPAAVKYGCSRVLARWRVPLFDTRTPLAPLRAALHAKVAEVLDAGRYILGPEVAAFEHELAAYLGAPSVIGVANGTDALVLALRAMGVGPGDDVVVPSFTFYASAEAIALIGANPVFCDVDPRTFCVTPDTVRAALTPQTKVMMAVHLFGNVAPVAEIEALGVPVLEDAAQALGSRTADGRRAGALGTAATFSFFPSKNLGAFGDGGAVATADADLADTLGMLRFHGSRDKLTFELVGHNSRLDELQAALLRLELPHLDAWCDGRRAAAAHYAAPGLGELAGLPRARRRLRSRVAPVRDPPRAGRRARRRARRRRDRLQGLLPRPAAPPAGDAPVVGRRAARHRRGGAHAPGDPDEPGAHPRAGRRGRRGRARCGSGLT